MTGEYDVNVSLTIEVSRNVVTGEWIGYCPALDLVARGDSIDEAATATREAVRLWAEHAERRRSLRGVSR